MRTIRTAPVLGAIIALLLAMIVVPAHARAVSPGLTVYDGKTKVGHGYAVTDQHNFRFNGSQSASFELAKVPTSKDVKYRGVYGSMYARHSEYRAYEMPQGEVWARVPVGRTVETERVTSSRRVVRNTAVYWYAGIYGSNDLYVQVKVCIDVKAWFDKCSPAWGTTRY